MVSCHMLLAGPWYKKNYATHDYHAKMYTGERGMKCVLVAMEKKLFKTWRKERLQKIKEQQKAQKEAKVSKIYSVHIQSAVEIVATETNSKPRMVLLEEGEDDTDTTNASVFTIHRVSCVEELNVQDINLH